MDLLNVICVNEGNYLGRGKEYVTKLRHGIERRLSVPYAFHVIEDTGLPGWWAKLAMFQPGRFSGRCLSLDLDTVCIGSLDHMANYRGPFAMLTDFFYPDLLASGVMMWEAGEADHVWTTWDGCNRPTFDERGDGPWVAQMMPNAKRLQQLFPGQIVSFKKHVCAGETGGARLVCFHGLPRPHQVHELMAHW